MITYLHCIYRFQYISCCSLSDSQGRYSGRKADFNTSHVVVYHVFIQSFDCFVCDFNTSHVVVYHDFSSADLAQLEKFQYISCCSLSATSGRTEHSLSNFNTSHVVVYLSNEDYQQLIIENFNTSHVVVYRHC